MNQEILPNEGLEEITEDEAAEMNEQTWLISQILFALDQETPSDAGTDYKPLYYGLFNGISLILKNTNTYKDTVGALKYLQGLAEDAYISQA